MGVAGASQALTTGEGEGSNPDWPLVLMNYRTLIRPGLLQNTVGTLNQLRAELQDVEACLAEERLRLARGWHQLEISVKLSHLQHEGARSRARNRSPR